MSDKKKLIKSVSLGFFTSPNIIYKMIFGVVFYV